MKNNILKRTQNFMTTSYSNNFMNKNFRKLKTESLKKFFSVLIPFVIIAITFSCEDNPNTLGANLIPDGDIIEYTHDTTLSFNSFVTDYSSVVTSNLGEYIIGDIDDDYFGKITCNFAGQYTPTVDDIALAEQVADSAYLLLRISNSYGHLDNQFELNIYEVSEDIIRDTSYYSDININDYYEEINKISLSTEYIGDTMIQVLLTPAFAQSLIPEHDSIYDKYDNFVPIYKGIVIAPAESNVGLYRISLDSSYIKLTYGSEDTVSQIASYSFSNGARFGNFDINSDSTGIIMPYLRNSSQTTDDLLFVQGLGGIKSKLIFSNYMDWIDGTNYSIMNAEITIPVFKDDNFTLNPPPEKLYLYYNNIDTLIPIIDAGSSYFNGFYNEDENNYTFNISRHLQRLLSSEIEDSSLHFRIYNEEFYPNRVMLNTGEDIKLRVTYTKH